MLFNKLRQLASSLSLKPARRRAVPAAARRSTKLNLEALEERAVPAVLMVTNLNDSLTARAGDGSLRGEILAAQNGQTIQFSSKLAGTINLAGTLTIGKNLTIDGSGGKITISGQGKVEDFSVLQGETVTLEHLAITNGTAFQGGGVFNAGTLTLLNCSFSNDTSTGAGGGAVANRGTLTVSGSTFTGNTSQSAGAAILNNGTLNVTGGTFTQNQVKAGNGGVIYNAGTATVSNSTFQNNFVQTGNAGAIFNAGTLTVLASTFQNDQAQTGNGGAIESTGTATISGCTFNGNVAEEGTGGGLYNLGTLTVTGDTFFQNMSVSGGGLSTTGTGLVQVSGSTFNDNLAGIGSGGGILNYGSHLVVTTSTFLDNFADQNGAGLANYGSVQVTQCAFLNNMADVSGGGLFNDVGTAVVSDSTFDGNSAFFEALGLHLGGGIANGQHGYLALSYNTLARNADYGLYNLGGAVLQGNLLIENAVGDFRDNVVNPVLGSANVIGSLQGPGLIGNGNQVGVTPMQVRLGALGYWGGPTQTIPVLPGSVAIGTGGTPGMVTTDQRGQARPSSGTDAGAFQTQTHYDVNIILDVTGPVAVGQTSLRQALTLANLGAAGSLQNIVFDHSLNGQVLFLKGGSLVVTSQALVRLAAALPTDVVTLDGLSKETILTVQKGSSAELDYLTLTHGQGVLNFGTLVLYRDTFTADAASFGGSLFGGAVENLGGNVQIVACNFSNDSADPAHGGGGAIENTGKMTIDQSTFIKDSAFAGGALFNAGSLTVTNSGFGQNTASQGANLFATPGAVTLF